MTDLELKVLADVIMRESEQNRRMAEELIKANSKNLEKLIGIMVDRRLCKLDKAQDALTGDEKPKFSLEPCRQVQGDGETCATHGQNIWNCVQEMTERLA